MNIRHTVNGYSISGDIAEEIYSKTKDIEWAKRMYESHTQAAQICEEINPKHSSHQYSYAGNAAKLMAMDSGEKEWIVNAIFCYEKFLDYYSVNDNMKVHKVVKRITSDVYLLKMSIDELAEE